LSCRVQQYTSAACRAAKTLDLLLGRSPRHAPGTFAGLHAELLADVEVWPNEPTIADLDGFAAEVEAIDR